MDDDAELAAHVVEEAGALAERMRREGLSAQTKTDLADLVTAADHAAEALVLQTLQRLRPDDAVVGEEGTNVQGNSGRTWVVDPIDGTYNFHRGLDWWCSAIALTAATDAGRLTASPKSEERSPILGAVHHVASKTTYVGGPEAPATRNGVPIAHLVDRPLRESCAVTYLHPRFYGAPLGEAFARAVSGVATLRMLGSGTMDAMSIVDGRGDVLFQHSVPDWDRMPGEAIIRSVGGDARRVSAGGRLWHVAGVPSAVAEACARLRDG